ncbi:MAG: GlsB/YeaQ/YmgE family stress response membrane protein [Candidatus Dormibacteria bacterium]
MELGAVTITIDPTTVLVWIIIGLVAGFLASRVMLGHGMGIAADIVVGIIGAIAGGLIASALGVTFNVPEHPIISQIVVAFLGALILLFVLRLFGVGRRRRLLR